MFQRPKLYFRTFFLNPDNTYNFVPLLSGLFCSSVSGPYNMGEKSCHSAPRLFFLCFIAQFLRNSLICLTGFCSRILYRHRHLLHYCLHHLGILWYTPQIFHGGLKISCTSLHSSPAYQTALILLLHFPLCFATILTLV